MMVAGSAVQKFGTELDSHQQILMAASDMLIEIYMAESTILRTEKLAKKKVKIKYKSKLPWQNYICTSGRYRYFERKRKCYFFVEGDEQRMMLMD
jgi:hypothetical protein